MYATMPGLISIFKILYMPVHTCTLAHVYVATHVGIHVHNWAHACGGPKLMAIFPIFSISLYLIHGGRAPLLNPELASSLSPASWLARSLPSPYLMLRMQVDGHASSVFRWVLWDLKSGLLKFVYLLFLCVCVLSCIYCTICMQDTLRDQKSPDDGGTHL